MEFPRSSSVGFLPCFLSQISRSQTTGVSHVAEGSMQRSPRLLTLGFSCLLAASQALHLLGALLAFLRSWKVVVLRAGACSDYWLETGSDELMQVGQPSTFNFTLDASFSKQLRSSSGFLQGRLVLSVPCRNSVIFFQRVNDIRPRAPVPFSFLASR